MADSIEQLVRIRAKGMCEYCEAQQIHYPDRFQIDHIIARQHQGKTELENLALCCLECNRRKGPNLSGVDPATGQILPLFHPRKDRWSDHFKWRGATLIGLTATGKATIAVLAINRAPRIAVRQTLLDEGAFTAAKTSDRCE